MHRPSSEFLTSPTGCHRFLTVTHSEWEQIYPSSDFSDAQAIFGLSGPRPIDRVVGKRMSGPLSSAVHDAPSLMPKPNLEIPACAGCARCCHWTVELTAGVDRVPEHLVVEREGVRCMDQRGDGACVALDPVSRLCTIYENRPQVCREFTRGESLCRRAVFGSAAAIE